MGDVHELNALVTGEHAVYVAQHQQRFEWPSMMLFDNAKCEALTPEWIDDEANAPQKLAWAESIGAIPPEWNVCVGYDSYVPKAKLAHFTQGIPIFPEVRNCDYSGTWWDEYRNMISTVSWLELMGKSVHAEPVLKALGVV
jgi:hypothetical protein